MDRRPFTDLAHRLVIDDVEGRVEVLPRVDPVQAAGPDQRQRERGWTAEVVRRSGERGHGQWRRPQMPLFTARRGFELVRRRWVVEPTFAWLGRNRGLSKDYEARTHVSEAMIWVAMMRLLVRRLAYP